MNFYSVKSADMIFLKKFKLTFTLIFGFILYGVSSFFYIRIFELGHLKYDFVLNDYIIFQVFSIIIAFLFELSKFRYSIEARYVSHKRQNHFFVYFVFLICCIVFSSFLGWKIENQLWRNLLVF